MIEKVALTPITSARRLRPYFQSHQIIVKTDHPIKQVLRKPKLTGRMIAWSIELSKFDLQYKPRGPMKSQFMVEFLVEFTGNVQPNLDWWILYVDGASNMKGSGADVILEGPNNVTLMQGFKFDFKVSNNQA